jgi:threonine/homoserine/homoserine lactone efflux protein
MNAEQVAAFFVFSVIAAITPGPSNVLLTATGAQAGFWRGLPCLFGVSAGMGSMMASGAYGLGNAIAAYPQLTLGMKLCGAAFLLWLAWKIATAPVGTAETAPEPEPTGFFGAAALQWVNPKAWLVSTGAVAAYLPSGSGSTLAQALSFALVFIAAALPSGLVWLVFGIAAQQVLSNPSRRRIFNLVMGMTLAASVAMVLA